MAAEPRRNDGGASPRGIDVKPEILRPAKTRQIRQGVDHAGGRGPRRADHHEWRVSISAICGPLPCQISKIHFETTIRGYLTKRSAADPRHMRDLFEPMMRFLRQID